jgi:hypothetical protein
MSGRPVLVICGIGPEMRRMLVEAATGLHHDIVIVDDPHNEPIDELRKDFRKFAKRIELKLPAAVDTTPSRGPKPRTKYPRRR